MLISTLIFIADLKSHNSCIQISHWFRHLKCLVLTRPCTRVSLEIIVWSDYSHLIIPLELRLIFQNI